MPYYAAGDYYKGDYYRAGDNYAAGGLFGTIGKVLGGAAKAIVGATPVGRALALIPSSAPQIMGLAAPPNVSSRVAPAVTWSPGAGA
jgi:hypothetical protein